MAEEKFAGRPQLQDGDIIRVKLSNNGTTRCFTVWDTMMKGVCVDSGARLFPFEQIVAVYRFDGRDFKCIWESVGYQFDRFKRIIDEINNTQLTISVKLKSMSEAMERYAKAAKGKASE